MYASRFVFILLLSTIMVKEVVVKDVPSTPDVPRYAHLLNLVEKIYAKLEPTSNNRPGKMGNQDSVNAKLETCKKRFSKMEGQLSALEGNLEAAINTSVHNSMSSFAERLEGQILTKIDSEFEFWNGTLQTACISQCCGSEGGEFGTIENCKKGMEEIAAESPYPYPIVYFKLDPANVKEFLCDTATSSGGWLILQRRINRNTDFYRGWDDYKTGFGSLESNFWIGLETIHKLTSSATYELRFDMKYVGQVRYAQYSSVKVASEADNYRLTIGSYSGTAGDSLRLHNNRMFSTKDRDNDAYSGGSCVSNYRGGWWYAACHLVNINGIWGDTTYARGLSWHSWTGYYKSLDFVEMKIRRVE